MSLILNFRDNVKFPTVSTLNPSKSKYKSWSRAILSILIIEKYWDAQLLKIDLICTTSFLYKYILVTIELFSLNINDYRDFI